MSENYRLPDYLDHIQQAAIDARSFVEGLTKEDFFADKRSQQAVIIIGEAATKVMDGYAKFTQSHPEVPWRSMRNMRNRMAHGYFDINLDVDSAGVAAGTAQAVACRASGCRRRRPQ